MKFESLKTNSVLLLLATNNLMIGCSEKCGQNYPEKTKEEKTKPGLKILRWVGAYPLKGLFTWRWGTLDR